MVEISRVTSDYVLRQLAMLRINQFDLHTENRVANIQRGILSPPTRAHRQAPPGAMINEVLKITSWTNGVSV